MRDGDSAFLSIRSNIPGIAWPPLSHGQVADLAAMLQQLDRTQWMDAGLLRAILSRSVETIHCCACAAGGLDHF